MKKTLLVSTLLISLLLAGCGTNSNVNSIMNEIEDYTGTVYPKGNQEIPIQLEDFLINYTKIAKEKGLLMPKTDNIDVHIAPSQGGLVLDGEDEPKITIHYNENNTINSVHCMLGCSEEYQKIIMDSLQLDDLEEEVDYTVEYVEFLDHFKVEGI